MDMNLLGVQIARKKDQVRVLQRVRFQVHYQVMPTVVSQQRVLEFMPERVSQVELRVIYYARVENNLLVRIHILVQTAN